MSTDESRPGPHASAARAPGALLLCRADPDSVAPAAPLLREPVLLARAGDGWSVLVPGGRPWQDGAEPVDRMVTGWATALAVATSRPVLALWWDADRGGYALGSGFRRGVGYVWLADGTPAGEDEAMRTFAARLGLDPVLDMAALDRLTEPDRESDARARLRGLLAVLTRLGVSLPAGLAPGEPVEGLRAAVRAEPGVREVEWPGWREAARPEPAAVGSGPPGPPPLPVSRPPGPRAPRVPGPVLRGLALAQIAAGVPVALWGLRRRSGGWIAAGALLLAHGGLGLARAGTVPQD